jgi:Mrp family chromosome partitioning ATPase
MNGSTQTANGRSGTQREAQTPDHTLNLEFASAYPVEILATTRPRASLAALDAFRTLALTIDSLAGDTPIRSMAFLSAVPGEGRSLSAELSSLAFSEIRPPVRLLDADPFQHAVQTTHHRRPRWRRKAARQSAEMEGERITLESASAFGDVPAFARIPVARDSYPGRSAFLQDVRSALDVAVAMRAQVLVDAPAFSLSSIGFSIAQMVDAAIYVVRPNWAALETHREVLAQLTLLKINVLGIVLNEG